VKRRKRRYTEGQGKASKPPKREKENVKMFLRLSKKKDLGKQKTSPKKTERVNIGLRRGGG